MKPGSCVYGVSVPRKPSGRAGANLFAPWFEVVY